MKFVVALLLMCGVAWGADRKVAITIDDLPRGGDGGARAYGSVRAMTVKLMKPFRDEKIPVTGFVNSGGTAMSATELRKILDLWLDAGAELGNHTATHVGMNSTPVAEFEADLLKGEAVLREAVEARGKKLEFFRFPFLQVGKTAESKRAVAEFLTAHGYRNAPVTFDDSDYMFARAYTDPALRSQVKREYMPYMESVVAFFEERSVEVVGREIPQVLLIHASQMNADLMPDLLAMFRRRGYAFVSLNEALRDEAYSLPEDYVGTGGFSWIHRWSRTKGMKGRAEPDEPVWLRDYFKAHSN